MNQAAASAPVSSRKKKPAFTPDPARWRVLAVVLASMFMSLVGVSIVNIALPAIQHGLNASQSDLQWVLSGYALMFGVVLVSSGRAGDIMGRGGLFLVGTAIFTASSVAAGLASDASWLNFSRFLQGVGSGMLSPQGIGMIQQYFRGGERGRAFGYLGTMVGFSVAIGPVLGGLLIELGGVNLGWRLTFLINVPIGIATLILAARWFPRPLFFRVPTRQVGEARSGSPGLHFSGPESVGPDTRGAPPAGPAFHSPAASQSLLRALDPVGAVLLALAVLSILFPFMEARSSPATWLLLPVGLALVYLWVKWERRYARKGGSPMVDLNIFRIPSFTNGTTLMTLYFMGMTSVWVLVAMYVQLGAGKSAFHSGLFGVPSALLSAYAADWAGQRLMRYGRRIVVAGLLIALVGLGSTILAAWLHESGFISIWWLVLTLSFIGLAQGSVISPNQALTLSDVPLDYAGSSGAILQTGQRIGSSIGIAVITAAAFAALDAASSWGVAFMVGIGAVALVVLLTLAVALKDLHDQG